MPDIEQEVRTIMEESAPRLPGWQALGSCFDVLRCDPIDITTGATGRQAFQIDRVFILTPDRKFRQPICADYTSNYSGTVDKVTSSVTTSNDYRSALNLQSTMSVSDPTGELFKSSMSMSYQRVAKEIARQEKVLNQTLVEIKVYNLKLDRNCVHLYLNKELALALASLPTAVGPQHQAFFAAWGTHFSTFVQFGGRVSQRSTIDRSEFESYLQEGMSISAEGEVTIEGVSIGGSRSASTDEERTTKRVATYAVESIQAVGGEGVPSGSHDMWNNTVDDKPAPIRGEFAPLYELLDKRWFPSDTDLDVRAATLKQATEQYYADRGRRLDVPPLQVGDQVTLSLVGTGKARPLTATDAGVATPLASEAGPAEIAGRVWTLAYADATETGPVVAGRDIVLTSRASGRYLDAQAGASPDYAVGDGQVGTKGDLDPRSGVWTVQFAQRLERVELSDGDYVRLRSRWPYSADEEPGWLLGEVDSGRRQLVFAFGADEQQGCVWRIARVHPAN